MKVLTRTHSFITAKQNDLLHSTAVTTENIYTLMGDLVVYDNYSVKTNSTSNFEVYPGALDSEHCFNVNFYIQCYLNL